jgi:hypothetical protein
MTDILAWLVTLHGDIQRSVADQISAFSASGDWLALLGAMPLAIVIGMARDEKGDQQHGGLTGAPGRARR